MGFSKYMYITYISKSNYPKIISLLETIFYT